MTQTEILSQAIESLWSELPLLVGGDWQTFQSQLTDYLKQLETEPARAPIIRAQILALFGRYPRAHQRLIEVMNEVATEQPSLRSASFQSVTRYSDVSLPREAEVGVRFSLIVKVTVERKPGAEELELHVPEGEREVEVTVIAQPNGLELVTPTNQQRLRVPLTKDSNPIYFELVGRQVGAASVTVYFFQEERYLGSVTAETTVKAAGAGAHANPSQTRGTLGSGQEGEEVDMTILIHESRGADEGMRYRFSVLCPRLGVFYQDMGEVPLPKSPELWANELMNELTQQARGLSSVSDKALALFGNQLYDNLCPPDMQRFYWERLHHWDDIQTVLLITSEPWVPWEMMKPYRKVGGDIVPAPHWCERFVMGRWLNGEPPPTTLPRGTVAVIAPRGLELSEQDEVDMLNRVGLNVQRVEARLEKVIEFLESDGCPGVHAISHGIFNLHNVDQAELWLENSEKLFPQHINGECLRFGRAKPLVFLNACNCGRSDFTYWGLGGWAKAMVTKAKCSAFIAPFWEIADDPPLAREFAEVFYTELLKGKPIGEAVRTARTSIKQTGNPTWLAYCLYGHPKASLSRA